MTSRSRKANSAVLPHPIRSAVLGVLATSLCFGYCLLTSFYAANPAHANVLLSQNNVILNEDFELGMMDPRMSIQTVGTFNSASGIKGVPNFGSAKAFGFGLSTCGASCFLSRVTTLRITLPTATFISSISFKEMELFSNWGSVGKVFIDGVLLSNSNFGKLANDFQPDTTFRSRSFTINRSVTIIDLRVEDITNLSEIYIDDLVITGNAPVTFQITSVSPNRGGNTGTVTTTIRGSGFQPGAVVRLREGNQVVVTGQNTVVTLQTRIQTSFDLRGQATRLLTLEVVNPDGASIALPQGFTIEVGRAPQVWVDIVGLNLIRPGRAQTFHLFYQNNSNVDVSGAFISVGFPSSLSYFVRDDQPLARTSTISGESILGFAVARIPAGGQGVLQFLLTVPPNFILVGQQFRIRARQLPFNELLLASTAVILKPADAKVEVECEPAQNTFWGSLFGEHYLFENCPTGQPWSVRPISCPACDGKQSAYEQQKALAACALNVSLAANHAFQTEVVYTSVLIIQGVNATVGLAVFAELMVAQLVKQGIIVAADKELLEVVIGNLIDLYAEYFKNIWLRDPNAVEHTLDNLKKTLAQEAILRGLLTEIAKQPLEQVNKFVDAWKVVQSVVDAFRSRLLALRDARDRMLMESRNFVAQNQQLCTAADSYIKCVNTSDCFDPPRPPIGEPADPGTDDSSIDVSIIGSFDPNDKIGSQGAGELRYISGEEPLRYSVFFENLETATAPAQEVIITDQLDTVNMDLNTFSLGPIAFGNKQVTPPPHSSAFTTDVDLRPSKNLIVRITASLNPNTGLLTWRLTSIDPTTGDFPADPRVGFLPPNVNPPEGDGSVLFTIMPKKGLSTRTQIRNQARIFFDTNAPIDTPHWLNTIDNTKPTSQVLPLATTQCSSFQLQWSGDDAGAGIQSYTILVSDNGGPFVPFLSNTTATSALFSGQVGRSYRFYSVASDKVGNLEDVPATPDATITIDRSIALSSTSQSFSKSGGSGSVGVLAESGCSWMAVSNASFISITSSSSINTGNGTVTYSVAPHSGTDGRTGTLTIAGQTFTVTQDAVADNVLPTIACPTAQSAVTNNGPVAVSYPAPTANDNLPGVRIACVPPAGANFPVGTTTVNCTASDAASNTAACSFTVTVRQPRPAIKDLITRVRALVPPLTQAQANGLIGHLEMANTSLERGQMAQACTHLQNFVTQVNAFVSGGQLTAAQGQALLSYPNKIRNAVGCAGSPFPL